jgi:hypothetical protein
MLKYIQNIFSSAKSTTRNNSNGLDSRDRSFSDEIRFGRGGGYGQSLLQSDYLSNNGGGGAGAGGGGGVGSNESSNGFYDLDDDNLLQSSTATATSTATQLLQLPLSSTKLMKIIGNILAVVTTLSFLIIVPLISAHAMIYEKTRPDFVAFYSAGSFVLITVGLSTKLIYNHLTNWYMPDVQKYVVRIVFMVPLYAIQSWLSLRFHNARIYIDILRDLYEAFVIQSFLYFLMELLGGEETLVRTLEAKDDHYGIHEPEFVLKYFIPKWEMGLEFMLQCKRGVLQYVIAKTIATIITACLEPIGMFNEGEFDYTKGYIYVAFIINLSQMWALYCLVKFYHATCGNLRRPVNWHPLGKFFCIKLVIFFTWWQGMGIAVLKTKGLIIDIGKWDKEDVANGLQDYLICVEMFCFAIAHSFTFTHKEYMPSSGEVLGSAFGSTPGRSRNRNRNRADRKGRGKRGRRGDHGQTEYGHDHVDFDDSDDDEDGDYTYEDDEAGTFPPIIRTLNSPMGFRDALWSSTVPNETFSDIRRFRNGVSDQIQEQSSEMMGVLRNVSMAQAESI